MSKAFTFLCGNAFKSLCQYSSASYSDARTHNFDFKVRDDLRNARVFVKLEYLPTFMEYIKLDFPYTLFTHNSDVPVTGDNETFNLILEKPEIKKWYSQNVNFNHPKLFSIPIGLANPKWPHGDPTQMQAAVDQQYWKNKNNILHCNFDIGTNPLERNKCLQETGLQISKRVPFDQYLEDMGKSYFTLSPNGNGIDCHKHWEALYLRTIPIVTKSTNIDFYKHLPFLVINDWEDYKNLNLSEELYNEIWGDFDPESLYFDNYVNSMQL